MAKNKGLLIAVAVVVVAVIVYFSTQQSKVSKTGVGGEIKMGIILGFTGPIESLTPAMAASAELAFKEASDSGKLLGGKSIMIERADSTCVDSAAATTAAEGLVSNGVLAIMGADCSGVTGAIATNVAVPNGVVMISPSATSPGLTTLDDKGYFVFEASNLLDVLKMQFIETARAKGLKESKIIWKHGVPNALHPIIMNQGRSVGYLIEGEIEVAIVLAIPTVGPLILSSVSSMDIYVASSIFMILSLILVIGNFVADCILALLDPRIRDMAGGAA